MRKGEAQVTGETSHCQARSSEPPGETWRSRSLRNFRPAGNILAGRTAWPRLPPGVTLQLQRMLKAVLTYLTQSFSLTIAISLAKRLVTMLQGKTFVLICVHALESLILSAIRFLCLKACYLNQSVPTTPLVRRFLGSAFSPSSHLDALPLLRCCLSRLPKQLCVPSSFVSRMPCCLGQRPRKDETSESCGATTRRSISRS